METGLRIVLLLVALIIVAGILWDTFRSRRKPSLKKNKISKTIDLANTKAKARDKESKTGLLTLFQRQDPSLNIDLYPEKNLEIGKNLDMFSEDIVLAKPKKSTHKILEDEKDALLVSPPLVKRLIDPEFHEQAEPEIREPETFFILNVMAKQPGVFLGKKLIEILDEVHLYYGEMQIFHRYENADGSGRHMFSLASAIEPGVFNLERLESYITPGITLFFSPTTRNHSIAAFELMLRTAKILAMNLDGDIKDQNRRPLTLDGIEKYRELVRASVHLHKAKAIKK